MNEGTTALNRAIRRHGKPKHIISDKGVQFWSPKAKKAVESYNHPYHAWSRKKKISTRFGAVGQHGSIAIVERFIRTLKSEGLRRIMIPFTWEVMQQELAIFIAWYNEHRPHQTLDGRTPNEVYGRAPPAESLEEMSNSELPDMTVQVDHFEGRAHLPIIEIKQAA